MGNLSPLLIGAVVLWFFFRFLRSQFQMQRPTDAVGESPGDPFTDVRSPRKNAPGGRAGAVALVEPDEEGPDYTFPPRVS